MSEIKKIKEEYFLKLNEVLDQNKLNEIKTELFGKNGIISTKFKKLGSIAEDRRKEFASELNYLKNEYKTL
jgi:phenylalanyl-tRNA synthetase alpha chain